MRRIAELAKTPFFLSRFVLELRRSDVRCGGDQQRYCLPRELILILIIKKVRRIPIISM